jgi:hypothetical protein
MTSRTIPTYQRPASFADIETGPEGEETIRRFTKDFKAFDELKVISALKRDYVTARDEVKGPGFIAGKLKDLREQHSAAEAEYWGSAFDKAALNPLTGRILAIGVRRDGKNIINVAENDKEERDILAEFLDHHTEMKSQDGVICGFNWEGFDHGFIRTRCQKHRLPWQQLQQGRYMDSTFRDLMHDFTGHDRTKFVSLDTLNDFLETGVRKNGDGAHFFQVFKDDRPKAIDYLANDLLMTEACAVGLGVTPKREYDLSVMEPADDIPFDATPSVRRALPEPARERGMAASL